jgi:hypothetical protein
MSKFKAQMPNKAPNPNYQFSKSKRIQLGFWHWDLGLQLALGF